MSPETFIRKSKTDYTSPVFSAHSAHAKMALYALATSERPCRWGDDDLAERVDAAVAKVTPRDPWSAGDVTRIVLLSLAAQSELEASKELERQGQERKAANRRSVAFQGFDAAEYKGHDQELPIGIPGPWTSNRNRPAANLIEGD